MPRNVRNFWLDASIDGQSTRLSGGPRAKDDGFTLTVKQRSEGSIIVAARIEGQARPDGTLALVVNVPGQESIILTTVR